MKMCSDVEMHIKTPRRYPYTPTGMAKIED